ncbi:hypothetical protein DESPIG_01711 [Desulfovibrio piger ATCC 29098]|uniref:Uncharacterized protein n=1 Tax=Desulfovibrio piger ATCC 29098 TaxID=411464 RepID=B6WUF3_9BACT|nr:hypothetical protein DESPIG_01711 [Desulfovibrio piger ATCC 29098]
MGALFSCRARQEGRSRSKESSLRPSRYQLFPSPCPVPYRINGPRHHSLSFPGVHDESRRP